MRGGRSGRSMADLPSDKRRDFLRKEKREAMFMLPINPKEKARCD
jgi:hypothetical protein